MADRGGLTNMPEKDFEILINSETAIRVYRNTVSGRLVTFAIVLLIYHGDDWIDIQRFDTAHGCPHQDILGKKGGLLQKIWYDDLSPKQVFSLAISTFKSNHEQIKADFLAH